MRPFLSSLAFGLLYRITFSPPSVRAGGRVCHAVSIKPRFGWAPEREWVEEAWRGAFIVLREVPPDPIADRVRRRRGRA